jgi:hypothetical protein
MKPELMEMTTDDRLATGEEVRRAVTSSSERLLELCQVQGDYCQMASDFAGIIRYPAEELEFFSYLSDTDDVSIN